VIFTLSKRNSRVGIYHLLRSFRDKRNGPIDAFFTKAGSRMGVASLAKVGARHAKGVKELAPSATPHSTYWVMRASIVQVAEPQHPMVQDALLTTGSLPYLYLVPFLRFCKRF
jgi:hypothetical protein